VSGIAFTSPIWTKENAGRERAHLAVAFCLDRFAPRQIVTVSSLFGAQESLLRVFTTAAPREMVCELHDRLTQPALVEVKRLEAIALSRIDGGFGVDAKYWYETMTQKVDLLGHIGGELADLIVKRACE
jgi:methyl-accepting chemotaxis protein